MNRYSISSDSRRWWMPSAAVGAVSTAAAIAIAIVPVTGHAIPEDTADVRAPAVISRTTADVDRHPCFLARVPWEGGIDGPFPPTCPPPYRTIGADVIETPDRSAQSGPVVMRSGLDSLP